MIETVGVRMIIPDRLTSAHAFGFDIVATPNWPIGLLVRLLRGHVSGHTLSMCLSKKLGERQSPRKKNLWLRKSHVRGLTIGDEV